MEPLGNDKTERVNFLSSLEDSIKDKMYEIAILKNHSRCFNKENPKAKYVQRFLVVHGWLEAPIHYRHWGRFSGSP